MKQRSPPLGLVEQVTTVEPYASAGGCSESSTMARCTVAPWQASIDRMMAAWPAPPAGAPAGARVLVRPTTPDANSVASLRRTRLTRH